MWMDLGRKLKMLQKEENIKLIGCLEETSEPTQENFLEKCLKGVASAPVRSGSLERLSSCIGFIFIQILLKYA